jgi:hypothetical protein
MSTRIYTTPGSPLKVMHIQKILFCNVGSVCNLVEEFNGLVSNKGWLLPALSFFLKLPLSTKTAAFPFLKPAPPHSNRVSFSRLKGGQQFFLSIKSR